MAHEANRVAGHPQFPQHRDGVILGGLAGTSHFLHHPNRDKPSPSRVCLESHRALSAVMLIGAVARYDTQNRESEAKLLVGIGSVDRVL